ncbi:hypothetical protein HK101_004844, partial [Irineochytrium annulatum]
MTSIPSLQLRYWTGVSDALESLGCEVFMPQVGTVSSIRVRALQLQRFLETHLAGREVNLVAHSMGGLDARYMIHHLPTTRFRVNSLCTIATPHRGSPFMDWCRDTLGLGLQIPSDPEDPISAAARSDTSDSPPTPPPTPEAAQESKAAWRRLIMASASASAHPFLRSLTSRLDAPAFSNLTTHFCSHLNTLTPDHPDVHYCSYAAVARRVSPLAPLYLPHRIIRDREGENDGLVSLESAKWGSFEGVVEGDHWELLPPKVR